MVFELNAQSNYRPFLAKEAKSCGHAAVGKRRDAPVVLISLQNDTDVREKTWDGGAARGGRATTRVQPFRTGT